MFLKSKKVISKVLSMFYKAQLRAREEYQTDNPNETVNQVDEESLGLITKVKAQDNYIMYINLPKRPRLQGARKYIMPKINLEIKFSKRGALLSTKFVNESSENCTLHPHISGDGIPCLGQHETLMFYTVQNSTVKDIARYAGVFLNTWTRNDAYWDINSLWTSWRRHYTQVNLMYDEAFGENPALQGVKKKFKEGIKDYASWLMWNRTLQAKKSKVLPQNVMFSNIDFIGRESHTNIYIARLKEGKHQPYYQFAESLLVLYTWLHENYNKSDFESINKKFEELLLPRLNFANITAEQSSLSIYNGIFSNQTLRHRINKLFILDWLNLPKNGGSWGDGTLHSRHLGFRTIDKRNLQNDGSSITNPELLNDINLSLSKKNVSINVSTELTDNYKFGWVLLNIYRNANCNIDTLVRDIENFENDRMVNITYYVGNIGIIRQEYIQELFKIDETKILQNTINSSFVDIMSIKNRSILQYGLGWCLISIHILNLLGYKVNISELIEAKEIDNLKIKHNRVASGYQILYSKKPAVKIFDWIANAKLTKNQVLAVKNDMALSFSEYINNTLSKFKGEQDEISRKAQEKREKHRREESRVSSLDRLGNERQNNLFTANIS